MARLAVLGATGRTGAWVVRIALEAGHEVVAVARDASRVAELGRLERVSWDFEQATSLAAHLRAADAVVSAIGHAGPMTEEQHVRERTGELTVGAMKDAQVSRLVAIASASLLPLEGGQPREVHPNPSYQQVFADQLGLYRVLQASGLDWVLVCPPSLPDGEPSGRALIAVEQSPPAASNRVSTGELARVMVVLALAEEPSRVRVGVAEPNGDL